jgi:HEAT repeat protein
MLPDAKSRTYFERGLEDKDDKIRAAGAEGFGRLGQAADTAKLEKAFEEETKMPARLGAAFGLVALGQTKTEEFSPLTYLLNTLNSRMHRQTAETYLMELSRRPEIRGALYPFVPKATREEKIGLARIFAVTGDREAIQHVESISKDADTDVAQEGLSALKALRARVN